ncbi:MAG: nitrogen regulation protein NR(II) [Pirellulales bacterium]
MFRIIAPMAAVSLLLLTVGATAAWYVHRQNKQATLVLSRNLDAGLNSERLVSAIQDVRQELDRCINQGEPEYLENALEIREETTLYLEGVARFDPDEELEDLIARTRRGHERIFDSIAELAEEPPGDDLAQQVHELTQELKPELLVPARELLEYNRAETQRDSERNKAIADRVGLGLLLLGACGAAAGLLAGYGIARGVSRSIVQLSLPIQDTAGMLNEVVGPITVATGASLGELEVILRVIAKETSAMVKRLQDAQRTELRSEQMAAIGQLAAGLAHELRNPLTSMKALVQLAGESKDESGLHGRDLAVLEEEIVRLELLTQTFLDFARPQQLDQRTLDLGSLVERTVSVVSGRALQQGVKIGFQRAGEPALVTADPMQIRQVVLNLLLNSLDVLPQGGTIEIQLTEQAPDDGQAGGTGQPWLALHMRDSGPGLPAGQEERIFEPFVSTRETGMGLGLSICKRIIEAHGGQISASNHAAGGAEFLVLLPGQKASPAASEPVPDNIIAHAEV